MAKTKKKTTSRNTKKRSLKRKTKTKAKTAKSRVKKAGSKAKKKTKKAARSLKKKAKRTTSKVKSRAKKTASKSRRAVKAKTKTLQSKAKKKARTATRAILKTVKRAGQSAIEASERGLQLVESATGAEAQRLSVGDRAPQFVLPNQKGEPISLESFRGKRVVLYFYPKDDTPGCTREACSFRDHLPNFEMKNAKIFGVSFDSPESHQKFIEKYGLNFDLLSDENKEVAESYGVHVQKNMYGKTYWGIERSTFVIGPDGRIEAAFRNVKVDGHTDEVMSALGRVA
ncbi:MAG: thioredoxin-dependent thiol peroxidase [Bradymonadales bacterium]|nr:MAG: thioredoxin-dependent thiol peroxidase [Bradymonadales bacterium]